MKNKIAIRLCAISLTAAIACSMMNITAFAAEQSAVLYDTDNFEEQSLKESTAIYDQDTGTLTLNGFESDHKLFISKDNGLTEYDIDDADVNIISNTNNDSFGDENKKTAFIYSEDDITIELIGSNTLSCGTFYGIVSGGNIEFTGSGSLVIEKADVGIMAIEGSVRSNDAFVEITNGKILAGEIYSESGTLSADNFHKSSTELSAEDFSEEASDELSSEDAVEESDELSTDDAVEDSDEISTEDAIEESNELSTETAVEESDVLTTDDLVEESDVLSTDDVIEESDELSTEDAIEESDELTTEDTAEESDELLTDDAVEESDELSTEDAIEESDELTTEDAVEDSDELSTDDENEESSSLTTEDSTEVSSDDSVLSPLELTPEDITASLDKPSLSLLAGDSARLTVRTSLPEGDYSVNWSTSNESLVLVPSGSSCFVTLPEDYCGDTALCDVTATVEYIDFSGSNASCCASSAVTIRPNDITNGRIISDNVWFTSDLDDDMYCRNELIYDGTKKTPAVKVYNRNRLLAPGKDYTVTYKNNINAADATCAKAPSMTITMKGMYTGSYTAYFAISHADLGDADSTGNSVICNAYTVQYNKKQQLARPVITYNGKQLKYGTDFIVQEFEDAVNFKNKNTYTGRADGDSTYNLTIYGRGNYCGKLTCRYTIAGLSCESVPQVLIGKTTVAKIPSVPFKGSAYTADDLKSLITVKYKNRLLSYPEDYDIVADDIDSLTNIGTAKVTLVGKGNRSSASGYSLIGSRTLSFKITGCSISGASAAETGDKNHVFTGKEIKPAISVTYKGEQLIEGTDYVLLSPDGAGSDYYVNAGTKTVIIKGINGFFGTKKMTFSIKPAVMSTASDYSYEITDSNGSSDIRAVYSKSGATPEIKVSCTLPGSEPVVLSEGLDYSVKYNSNSAVSRAGSSKKPAITITGKGNYKGSLSQQFTIVPADIGSVRISACDLPETAKKGTYKAKLTLTDSNGKTLKAGSDYSTAYKYYDSRMNDLDIGSASGMQPLIYVSVEGIGNYCGSVTTSYRTYNAKEAVSVNKLCVAIDPVMFTGLPLEPLIASSADENGIHIYKSSADKKASSDVTDPSDCVKVLSYSSNTKVGTGKVTLQGIGSYYGTRTCSFKITKQPVRAFISIITKELTLKKGACAAIDHSKSAAAASGTDYSWVSSDPNVAAVDANGTVTAVKSGAASIYAVSSKLDVIGSCTVNVKDKLDEDNPDFINIEKWRYYEGCSDIEAIKKAIEKAHIAQEQDGRHKTIYIPSGTYIIPVQEQISFDHEENMSLLMEENTYLKTTFDNNNDYSYGIAINVRNSRNITISGGELIGDRDDDRYDDNAIPDDKEVYGINIRNSSDISVSNVKIHDFWYDGLYIGNTFTPDINTYSSRITINNCEIKDNRRNNVSLTAARDTVINNCDIVNASGIDPECGIDIETNNNKNPNKNVTISNSTIEMGGGQGAFSIPTAAENIVFENCEIYGICYNHSGKNLVFTDTKLNGTYYKSKKYPLSGWAQLK